MNNYEFCAGYALNASGGRSDFKVLDYGCGAGEVVSLMHRSGLNAYGCETFYEGGDTSEKILPDVHERIFRMQGDRIPFPDETFDLVVTNMVLEHVADLDVALDEIARVLKPGAACLALFPHREVWREGHCEMPFVHRLPKSAARLYYVAALRQIGLGVWRGDLSPMDWARNFCDWHDRYCYYRPLSTIREAFGKRISPPKHIEAEWAARRSATLARLPAWIRTLIARKAAGVALVSMEVQ